MKSHIITDNTFITLSFCLTVFTHAGCIAAGMYRPFILVYLSVRTLKGKWLELSTPNLVHTYSIVVAKVKRSRSHGYENRHVRTVASDASC